MNMTEIKKVKAKDFDWEAFSYRKFHVAMRSKQSVISTLHFLSEKGYKWGMSKTSLIKDRHMRDQLCSLVDQSPVYISCGGLVRNGIVRDFLLPVDTDMAVEIDFNDQVYNDKIVIINDGKTTTATLYSNGKKAGIGTAVCHDNDKFDVYAGAKLALERLEKSKKKPEMTDWERFVKDEVNMRVSKKYLQNFLGRAAKDGLNFKGLMSDWYIRWLEQDGDSIVVSVNNKIDKVPILTEVLCNDGGITVNYIPGMK